MKNEILLETNIPVFMPNPEYDSKSAIWNSDSDFTVKPEDYTYVDAREKGFEHAFGSVSFASVELAVEKLGVAMKKLDGVLLKEMQNSLLDMKDAYDKYKRNVYLTAPNNQLKRHRLPMRRKKR